MNYGRWVAVARSGFPGPPGQLRELGGHCKALNQQQVPRSTGYPWDADLRQRPGQVPLQRWGRRSRPAPRRGWRRAARRRGRSAASPGRRAGRRPAAAGARAGRSRGRHRSGTSTIRRNPSRTSCWPPGSRMPRTSASSGSRVSSSSQTDRKRRMIRSPAPSMPPSSTGSDRHRAGRAAARGRRRRGRPWCRSSGAPAPRRHRPTAATPRTDVPAKP